MLVDATPATTWHEGLEMESLGVVFLSEEMLVDATPATTWHEGLEMESPRKLTDD
ncbi:hypothetical protein J6590_046500 [Homalodisca vitripennis]|nr:hypothetical protein J6590_046500 [Homalodisca vitripennis]